MWRRGIGQIEWHRVEAVQRCIYVDLIIIGSGSESGRSSARAKLLLGDQIGHGSVLGERSLIVGWWSTGWELYRQGLCIHPTNVHERVHGSDAHILSYKYKRANQDAAE